MAGIYEKLFASIRHGSPYLPWAEQGLSPSEIKTWALTILGPYFQNPSVLNDISIGELGHEAVAISQIQSDPWAASMLSGVLSEYHAAQAEDQPSSIASLEAWSKPIELSMSEFFSIYVMEVDKTGLQLDEFRLEIFRNIGGLVEACIQPHIKALLNQVRIRRRRKADVVGLSAIKLGETVEELYRTLRLPGLVAPPPWNVKLHVWRNVAQHHSAKIQNGRIVCDYRTGKHTHQIELTRNELLSVARQMQQVLGIVRAARTICLLDNGPKLGASPVIEIRPEILFFEFAVGIATQGFDLLQLNIQDRLAHLHVQDVTEGDATGRGIHASQFLVGVWMNFRKPVVQITYRDSSGRKRLEATATAEDCEDIAEERVPFETLASRVRFKVFKS